jgi:hypothetical protein
VGRRYLQDDGHGCGRRRYGHGCCLRRVEHEQPSS